ncbi:OLC1v1035401C1 [Oldenlandia corymbosa var. corymbosa]|uniref:50S ribosomal protein L35 n=1 Tax=Oldenlandia corymbosa var. corymbosa TaxID=529605 RepID=A0AAV1CSZ3_OLDCO|nr:OLC1v1035401C1 [Oldenlandia corymbosa var. corymbosa]
MASSITATMVFSLGLKGPPQNHFFRAVQFPPLAQRLSSNVSFTHSVSGLSPLVLGKVPTFTSPSQKDRQPFTVFSAKKGYKMKTHKASAKRFRVSGSGKIMRRRAGKQHLLRKKNTKRRLRLSKMVQVDRSDYDNVIGALPYLKVNRAN